MVYRFNSFSLSLVIEPMSVIGLHFLDTQLYFLSTFLFSFSCFLSHFLTDFLPLLLLFLPTYHTAFFNFFCPLLDALLLNQPHPLNQLQPWVISQFEPLGPFITIVIYQFTLNFDLYFYHFLFQSIHNSFFKPFCNQLNI